MNCTISEEGKRKEGEEESKGEWKCKDCMECSCVNYK